MEEEKIVSKEVKMEPQQKQKLDYEELNQVCAEMSQQLQNQNSYIQKMHKQMREMDIALQVRRMDYLFRVVELASQYKADSDYPCFSSDFVESCIVEIQESLTIPPQEDKEAPKEN